MKKHNDFSESIERIKEQTEVPVFPDKRLNLFYSGYVDNLDEASDVLEEKVQSEENDNDVLGPISKI